jgi:hypothetical protein
MTGTLLLALAALAGTPTPAPQAPPPAAAASASPTWDRMRPLLGAQMRISRQEAGRWLLTLAPLPDEGEPGDEPLRAAARETMKAALDDIVWLVGGVTNGRYKVPGPPMKIGDVVSLPDRYLVALFEDPSFTDPLRRFADAALRGRGLSCADCLAGVRPSREIRWMQIRPYFEGLIYVKEISEDGRVDLRIGQAENGLPEFSACDQDVAGAAYAALQATVREAPEFGAAVERALNSLIADVSSSAPAEARVTLNKLLPQKVLKDPGAFAPLVARLPQALEKHGLHCLECAGLRLAP